MGARPCRIEFTAHAVDPAREFSAPINERLIDDTGEDYLFPTSLLAEIDLPDPIREKLNAH